MHEVDQLVPPLCHPLKIGIFPPKEGKVVQAALRDVPLFPSDTFDPVRRWSPLEE